MKKILIECHYCKNEIYIDEILAQKMRTELEQELKKRLTEKDKELEEIKKKLTAKDEEISELKRKLEEEYKRKLNEKKIKNKRKN